MEKLFIKNLYRFGIVYAVAVAATYFSLNSVVLAQWATAGILMILIFSLFAISENKSIAIFNIAMFGTLYLLLSTGAIECQSIYAPLSWTGATTWGFIKFFAAIQALAALYYGIKFLCRN